MACTHAAVMLSPRDLGGVMAAWRKMRSLVPHGVHVMGGLEMQEKMTDEVADIMLRRFSFVKTLNLKGCYLLSVVTAWPVKLTSVELSMCSNLTDAAVVAVAEHCAGLTSLSVAGCKNLTDAAVVAVAEHCGGLTSLNVSYCKNLTDAAVVAVAEHCAGLTSLDVRSLETFSGGASSLETYKEILAGTLTSFKPMNPPTATDASLVAVAERCAGLTSLSVAGCKILTDAAVVAVAEHCAGLTSLSVAGCEKLTDAAVVAVAEHCVGLTSLDVHDCSNLTDAAVVAVA
jgi:ribonuclease HIII